MNHSKLSDHKFEKGKFITPFNAISTMEEMSDDQSWAYGRMPEYLWIGLILHHFGRDEGLEKLCSIILELHNLAPEMYTARMSKILELDSDVQRKIYNYIIEIASKQALAPLTLIFTASKAPEFSESFYCKDLSIKDRCDILTDAMRKLMDHQSNESTDVRFAALYFNLLSGKLHLPEEQINLINKYPKLSHKDELMRIVRPSVRSIEMMLLAFEKISSGYIQNFWRCISKMTDCSLYLIEFPEGTGNIADYMEKLHEIYVYFSELFTSTSPLDDKMNVLLGIATYSYKRLKEAYDHKLFNAISGRSCIRILIENYIMMKYLVKNESSHEDIWRDYQLYGLGLYKLVLERHRENDVGQQAHFDQKYIEWLVNEFKAEDFIDMDTKYFDKQNVRSKAESVDEKLLFGLYYDYDSSFEHGMWGAIRESSLLKCNNPAHQYHCVPDVDDQIRLKSVLPDCVMVMNKTLSFLDELYGIPNQLLNEVINFEIKPVDE